MYKIIQQIKHKLLEKRKCMVEECKKKSADFDIDRIWEVIYLIILIIYVGCNVLFTTTLDIVWPPDFFKAFKSICIVLTVIRMALIENIPQKYFIAITIVAFVFLMSHYISGFGLPLDLLILVIGAYKVDFEKILKTYIAIWVSVLTVVIIYAMTGITQNLVFYDGESQESIRMAMGLSYPTELAGYVLFLMMACIFIRQEEITYVEIGIMSILSIAIYFITHAKTDFIMMLLLQMTVLLSKKYKDKLNNFIQRKRVKIGILAFPVLLGVVIWRITAIYSPDKILLTSLNEQLSDRLYLGELAMRIYPPKMFGQYVMENGPGENIDGNYFFIDSSYISISIKYGVVFIYTLLIFWCYRLKQFCENNKCIWTLILLIMFIQGVLEHHLSQYWFNPFLLMFLADMRKFGRKKTIETVKSDIKLLNLN